MATVRIAARFATAFVALTAFAPKAPDTAADAATLKVDSPAWYPVCATVPNSPKGAKRNGPPGDGSPTCSGSLLCSSAPRRNRTYNLVIKRQLAHLSADDRDSVSCAWNNMA